LKASIVIPVYNAEKYVNECINSALNQSYSDIEIIAVNDGSTDNSLKILENYSDKIKIISKENGGTPTALNAGIKAMKGEWFKWLSADDVLKKDAIEVLVNEAKKIDDFKSCIFYSNYDLIDQDSNIIGEFIEPNFNELSPFERNVILLDHFYGNGTTSLIHKSIFEQYGHFDEKIGFQEDYEFWLKCCLLHNCKLHLIPKNLAQYRIHESQLTKKKIDESLSHAETVRKLVLSKLDSDLHENYLNASKKYKKQKPFQVKIRRKIRDVMFNVLPKSTSEKILQMYINHKKY